MTEGRTRGGGKGERLRKGGKEGEILLVGGTVGSSLR